MGSKSRSFQRTSVLVCLRRVGVSVVDDRPQETLYGCLDNITLQVHMLEEHTQVRLGFILPGCLESLSLNKGGVLLGVQTRTAITPTP